jgi:hypothetical protein
MWLRTSRHRCDSGKDPGGKRAGIALPPELLNNRSPGDEGAAADLARADRARVRARSGRRPTVTDETLLEQHSEDVRRLRSQIQDPSFRVVGAAAGLGRRGQRTFGSYVNAAMVAISYAIPLFGFWLRERRLPTGANSAKYELLIVFQHLVAAGCLLIASNLGASSFFLVPGAMVFYVALCVLNRMALKDRAKDDSAPASKLVFALCMIGAAAIGAMLILAMLAAWLRVDAPEGAVVVVPVVLVLYAIAFMMVSVVKDPATPWVHLAVALTVIPLLLAWLTASAVTAKFRPLLLASSASPLADTPQSVLARRKRWAAFGGWRGEANAPLTVAVSLSGGGYRAASIHAGLLHAFDEKCVPIRYLSTVSGGSILGSFYALGYTPQQFEQLLRTNKPGLPDKFISIPYLPFNWWNPGWNNSDTYTEHLDSTFFHGKRLQDTDLAPQLIINATDIENTGSREAREVFFKGRNTQFPQLDETPIADLVAASGAYPGAFQPKTVTWPLGDGDAAPQARRFVDGGVVENLGYTGWERFVRIQKPALPRNTFVVISDASAEVASGPLPAKIDLMTLLSRSQDISWGEQHAMLKQYIHGKASPLVPGFLRAQDTLKPLSERCFLKRGLACLASGHTVADEVGRYSTLSELEQDQVEKAFWVGYQLGDLHWPELNRWRLANSGEQRNCPVGD